MITANIWSRILIVNDHPGQLDPLTAALVDEGHDVVGCSTMAEAVGYARREPFAVAVIDVQSPDETGVELLGHLTRMNGNVRVVMNAAFQPLVQDKESHSEERLTYVETKSRRTPSSMATKAIVLPFGENATTGDAQPATRVFSGKGRLNRVTPRADCASVDVGGIR